MVSGAVERLRRDYPPAFLSYLARRDEKGLQAAYELGRTAMSAGVSILDLVGIHQGVYADVVRTMDDVEEMRDAATAAGAFLIEALAPFDMAQRAYRERTKPGCEGDLPPQGGQPRR